MRSKWTCLMLVGMLGLWLQPAYAALEPSYFHQMGSALTRSAKNLISFPWEISATIKQYDQNKDGNYRAFRDTAGFFDGSFRALTRLGSGVWDLVFAFVPGQQDEILLKPETLF